MLTKIATACLIVLTLALMGAAGHCGGSTIGYTYFVPEEHGCTEPGSWAEFTYDSAVYETRTVKHFVDLFIGEQCVRLRNISGVTANFTCFVPGQEAYASGFVLMDGC